MNWIDLATAAQKFFFLSVATAIAGSIFVMIILLLERVPKWNYSRMKIVGIKTALLLYLIPLAAVLVISSRREFSVYGVLHFSEFGKVVTPPMQKVYILLAFIWLLGFIPGIFFRITQYQKLKNILYGNIPIENENILKLIEVYKKKYRLKHVQVYQNDLINFPITVKSFRPEIILPLKSYTEKELHMVLEHEMNHIRHRDLLWKKAGLIATFIHWWNPLTYILLDKLILQEEIECDIETCESNSYFTMREYGYYLFGMPDSTDDMIFSSALCKSKKDLFKRLEAVSKRKDCKKWAAILISVILVMLSAVPSYAVSESIARVNETWIDKTDVETKVDEIDYRSMESTTTIAENDGIEEIDLFMDGQIASNSAEIVLDDIVGAYSRVLYNWKDMKAEDVIFVSCKCSDNNIIYAIGIRDTNGKLIYRQGRGNMSHIFKIPSDGRYTFFIENRNRISVQISGWTRYPE